jgi:glycosyltransferase involved in cell wall biosynthesis
MSGFSIILPTFRRHQTLKRAIESVKSQTFQDWELIVVDNDCDQGLDFGDQRIHYYAYPEPRGACHARNYGIGLAAKDIVTFLDDDDILYNNYLLEFHNVFATKPQIQVARCLMRLREQIISSLATIQVAVRRSLIKPLWTNDPKHDQVYFSNILKENGWDLNSPEVITINKVLCQAMHADHGGLRNQNGRL